ncbi:cytochrome c3 family protein [Thermodesulfobacteriota bacterium]
MNINKGSGLFTKTFFIITLCLSAVFILTVYGNKAVTAVLAGEPENTTDIQKLDVIVIDNKDYYEKDRKGPVSFPHKKHAREYKLLCWECHHEYEDGKNIYSPWGATEKCSECHDPEEKQDDVMKLQTAYHLNCKICHKTLAIFGDEPLVYRKCTKCHENAQ